MSKKIIITESEKSEIKRLHNISEQDILDKIKLVGDLLKRAKENRKDVKLSDDDVIDNGSTNDDGNYDYLDNTSEGSVDSKWMKVTKKVIDKFEGGYWNGSTPKNKETSKFGICSNHPSGSMGASTETLFGLDRFNGAIESSPEGKEFFRIIDKQKKELGMQQFCKKWKWGYKGGDLEDVLKSLAAKIMKKSYDRNSSTFSPELKKRVENNDRLLLHFSYASWNGPGFFKKFAQSLNDAVKEGKTDKELIKQAITDRKNTKLHNQKAVADVLTDPNLNLS